MNKTRHQMDRLQMDRLQMDRQPMEKIKDHKPE